MSETKFASIAPRFTGENTKRAPIAGDTHKCQDGHALIIEFFTGVRIWYAMFGTYPGQPQQSYSMKPITHCPYCGGLLPTQELHEGTAQEPPQDTAAHRQREDAEIRAAWKTAKGIDWNHGDLRRELSTTPRRIFSAYIRGGEFGISPFYASTESNADIAFHRTGAELLALLFGETKAQETPKCEDCAHSRVDVYDFSIGALVCVLDNTLNSCKAERGKANTLGNCGPSGKLFYNRDKHKNPVTYPPKPERLMRQPSAWVSVTDALPDDCALVNVKMQGGEIGIAECYRRDKNNWHVTLYGGNTFWTRSGVKEWRAI